MFSAIRLLLLDLDDTLFDCAGTLVPAAHRDAVAAMVAAGLPGPAADRLAELDVLLRDLRNASVVYPRLCARHGCTDPAIAEAGRRAFFERDVPPLEPFAGVRDALATWRGRFLRVVVTFGDPATQRRKIERLDLASLLDGVRHVGPGDPGGKESAFRAELAHHRLPAAAALVVGNRRDDEIAAGNRLGCVTVLLEGGEYAGLPARLPEEAPTFTVPRFADLAGLLAGA
jgi:FMN phosphatase YigB (HAD superfamily)